MADIANPDLFVCGCRSWICLDITRFYEEERQPSSGSEWPASPKTINRAPLLGREVSTQFTRQFVTAVTAPPLVGCVVWTPIRHFVFGLPHIRMCVRGLHFVNLMVHLFSILTICPAHIHLDLLICGVGPVTYDCFIHGTDSFNVLLLLFNDMVLHGTVPIDFGTEFNTYTKRVTCVCMGNTKLWCNFTEQHSW